MLDRIAGTRLPLGRQGQAVLVKALVDLAAGGDPQIVQPLSHLSSAFWSTWPGGWNLHRADPATPDRPASAWQPAGRPWTAKAAATRARAKALRSPGPTRPVASGVEAELGSLSRCWRLRLALLGSTSSQPGSTAYPGDTTTGPPEGGNDRGWPEGGTMDTSRGPDRPIHSRADQQVRQVQGLQLMTWILSWIQSWPLSWIPVQAPSSTAMTRWRPPARTRAFPRRAGRSIAGRGWRRPPAWRLGASGGRHLRATGAEPTGGSMRRRAPNHRPTSVLAISSIAPYPQSRCRQRQLHERPSKASCRPDSPAAGRTMA
jgi:hypothetical protein